MEGLNNERFYIGGDKDKMIDSILQDKNLFALMLAVIAAIFFIIAAIMLKKSKN
jgi:hypothetical protein